MNLYEAIYVRQSVREFRMEPLEASILEALHKFIKELELLCPDIPFEIKIHTQVEDKPKLFSVKAPYYISIISKVAEGFQMNAGFIMEQIALFLTCKGVGTCYQGSRKLVSSPEDGYQEVMVMAMGYSLRYLYREDWKAKRYPLGKVSVFKEEADKSSLTILKAACLSPSSLNNQPWRFVVYNSRIHIFLKKETFGVTKNIRLFDMGIAISHMVLAAEELWVDIKLERLPNISNQSFKNNQYVISMLFS